jgi:type I restriction enzyme, S subunit
MTQKGRTRQTVAEIAAKTRWALNGGPFGSKLVSSMYVSEGVPIIRGTNLPHDKRFEDSGFVFVTQEKALELRQHEARPGDIVITQRGTLGQVGLIPINSQFPSYIVSQSQMKLTVDQHKCHPLFIYYMFRAPSIVQNILDRAMSTGVPHINLALLRNFPIELPPLPTQHRIASILGAYDDLIETNRRRTAILEEMARGLFDEWFVRFRFPGHDASRSIAAFEGLLPRGWEEVPLSSLCQRITDGAHFSPPTVAHGRFMASVKDMREWDFDLSDCRQVSEEDYGELVRNDCCPLAGDILIAKDGANLNKHTFLMVEGRPLVVLSSIAILRPHADAEREFLVATLRSNTTSAAIKQMKSGAAIPRIVLRDFKRLPVILPPQTLRQRFEVIVGPIHSMCRRLGRTNANLAMQRDLLLPRLISGELSISAAEDELKAAA